MAEDSSLWSSDKGSERSTKGRERVNERSVKGSERTPVSRLQLGLDEPRPESLLQPALQHREKRHGLNRDGSGNTHKAKAVS